MRGVVVHRSPAWFMVDGGKKTLEPVGLKGNELKALVSFVVADTFFLDDVMARLRDMNITVSGFFSSSTGEADWGLRPLFAGDKTPPSMYNISYYKNPTVDADIMKALGTTDRAEKTKLYTEVQEEIWKDAPWAFLVTEKLLYATSKKLTGMYVMPDANYFFEEIDLQ